MIKGRPDPQRECLVRVHEPFTVIDAIDMESRAHSWSLGGALRAVAEHGEGVVVLLNCAPAAGVLISKLAPSAVAGASAVVLVDGAASSQLRHYGIGAAILRDVGVGKMLLLSPPRKMPSMMGFGLEVTGYRGGELND